MNGTDLSSFDVFLKDRKPSIPESFEVWLYSRVSSRDQFDNHSLDIQKKAAYAFAAKNGFTITKTFGGTYESAASDLSRKEFQRLITEVRNAKIKPFAILIYKANRFSRTGGNAIKLLMELENVHHVHLIEVTSGLISRTEREKLDFMKGLLKAREENLDRLDVTLPAMKAYLENGNWLGNVPRGYTQFGPRVKQIERIRGKQEIKINEEGKLLQKAWLLKLEGYSDVEIKNKLTQWGMKNITKQFLSSMWRKPFYCGVNTNRLLNNSVKGNWEPMISIKNFQRVNSLLTRNNQGYKTEKGNASRPLVGTLYCPDCNKKLTGYEVKKKSVHYYSCPRCKGVNINAKTTSRSRGIGANNLFEELLDQFSIPSKYCRLLEKQINKILDHRNEGNKEELKKLRTKHSELEKNLELLDRRFVFDQITKEQKNRYSDELLKEDFQICELISRFSFKISNQQEKIKIALLLAQNISKIWGKGNPSLKIRLQKLIFPEGIIIDTKNRKYLTKKINGFFELIINMSINLERNKKGLSNNEIEKSLVVAGAGLEPTTFGL